MVVTGWKDIANYLRCGIRTVQRWEEGGMPIHRPLPGKRSHVVAYTEELDWWVRDHQPRHAVPDNVIVSIAKAQKLREEARSRRAELRTHMQALRHEIEGLRAKRRNGFAPPLPKQRESSVAV
jgi:phage terminase Nu1 subunit (DNA packaging protein)